MARRRGKPLIHVPTHRSKADPVRKDTFRAPTPEGEIEFTNIIATFDVEAERKVVLGAHHDSKWFKDLPESEVSPARGVVREMCRGKRKDASITRGRLGEFGVRGDGWQTSWITEIGLGATRTHVPGSQGSRALTACKQRTS